MRGLKERLVESERFVIYAATTWIVIGSVIEVAIILALHS